VSGHACVEVLGEKQAVGCPADFSLKSQVICAPLLKEKNLVLGRQEQQFAPKRWDLSATLHSIKPQKTTFLKHHLYTVFRYFIFTIITAI
jgi:hypothetical protein